ncbi:MAG: hypothetical protein Q8Q45_09895 [Methylococcaceae bacterium]|nr:hypothetical protein [Methylococcaceae bacterium]MDP3932650.1 hypothetical protein [Methylococcaceae bacterium]
MWAPNFDTYNFDYDDGGRLTAVYYPNGVNQTLAWNADGSLKQVSHKNAATVLAQNVYGYDGLGRRNANQETLSGQTTLAYTYQYDPLDRLTQVDNGTATQRQNYAYDALSNRVQKQLGNPVTATTAYKLDAANQLTEVRQTNLAGTLLEATLYDNNGNQSKKAPAQPSQGPATPPAPRLSSTNTAGTALINWRKSPAHQRPVTNTTTKAEEPKKPKPRPRLTTSTTDKAFTANTPMPIGPRRTPCMFRLAPIIHWHGSPAASQVPAPLRLITIRTA